MRETDVPAKLMAFGDPVVQRFSRSRTAPYTEADARGYFAEQEQGRVRGEELNFAFVELDDDDVVLGESIAAGDEVLIHRYDLPDDHPERDAGAPGDYFVLGTDDTLRPYDSPRG